MNFRADGHHFREAEIGEFGGSMDDVGEIRSEGEIVGIREEGKFRVGLLRRGGTVVE